MTFVLNKHNTKIKRVAIKQALCQRDMELTTTCAAGRAHAFYLRLLDFNAPPTHSAIRRFFYLW